MVVEPGNKNKVINGIGFQVVKEVPGTKNDINSRKDSLTFRKKPEVEA